MPRLRLLFCLQSSGGGGGLSIDGNFTKRLKCVSIDGRSGKYRRVAKHMPCFQPQLPLPSLQVLKCVLLMLPAEAHGSNECALQRQTNENSGQISPTVAYPSVFRGAKLRSQRLEKHCVRRAASASYCVQLRAVCAFNRQGSTRKH
jgi:hypothetical protein